MAAPDLTIDYERFATLPVGLLPSDADAALQAAYFRYLGLQVGVLQYGLVKPADVRERPSDPDEPLAPQFTAAQFMRVRLAGSAALVVPRSVTVDDPANETTRKELTKTVVDAAVAKWRQRAVIDPADDAAAIALKVGKTIGFDDKARTASGLPIPFYPDESLALLWPKRPAPPPAPSAAARSGILDLAIAADGATTVTAVHADAAATVLLGSTKDSWSGELDPTLLRAPVFGLMRFERYRHVTNGTGAPALANPSAAGRLVVRGFDRDAAPAAGDPAMVRAQTFVFENVARDSAVAILTGLLSHQVLQTAATIAADKDPLTRPIVKAAAGSALTRLYRAWLTRMRHLGKIPAGFEGLANDFKAATNAGLPKCIAVSQKLAGDAAAATSILDFVRNVYAPLACGASWNELGVALPVASAQEPRKTDAKGHAFLVDLANGEENWTLVYAGCPIGRPAPAYAVTPPADAAKAILEGYGTFELEALHLAGLANNRFGAGAPAPASEIASIDLTPFAAHAIGRCALLRVVETHNFQANYGRVQEFTTRDWLLDVLRGRVRRFFEPPPVDLSPYAVAADHAERHPFASVVDWDQFQAAARMRTLTDAAEGTRIGARSLSAALLEWWGTRMRTERVTNFHDSKGVLQNGPTWPAFPPDGEMRKPPGPKAPYAKCATAGRGAVVDSLTKGLDVFDFDAVRRASKAVRDGGDFGPIHPSLPLALAEREGYWTSIARDRMGEFQNGIASRDMFDAGFANRADIRRTLSVAEWLLFPFGLDLMVNAVARNPKATSPSGPWRNSVLDQFETVVDLLTTTTVPGDPTKSILDPDALPRAAIRDYLECSLEMRWGPGAADPDQIRRLSRRGQWIGIALQLAVFQLVHRLIRTQAAFPTDPGAVAHVRPAAFAAPPPRWSAGANAAARRDYLCYYALVYLAFNTSALTFNRWVAGAEAENLRRVAAGDPPEDVCRLIVLWRNTAPDAIEPGPANRRLLGQRGNMMRFAVGLDAASRLDFDADAVEADDPADRTADPVWKLIGE